MIMNLGLSGVPFAGGDVGGFQGNATGELFARWMQMGIFTPFFRGHSARGTKPHEPWAFGGAVEKICRRYIKLRYALLPYLYTEFYKCSQDGLPMVRPLVLEYPGDAEVYDLCDEFLFGESLLAAPVYRPATERRIVYLPEGQWYDYWTDCIYPGKEYHTVYAPLDTLPLFVKNGSILPMTEPADHAGQKKAETLILEVYAGTSSDYLLYEDDGTSMQYREGIYSLTLFSLDRKGSSCRFSVVPRRREYNTGRKYYSVRFHGLKGHPKSVCSTVPVEETFDEQRGLLSLLLPDTAQSKDCGGELFIEIRDINT
jgi:alpha-glucosidase